MILVERCSAGEICGSNFIYIFMNRWIKTPTNTQHKNYLHESNNLKISVCITLLIKTINLIKGQIIISRKLSISTEDKFTEKF
jgi:hypothetical protein